MTFNLQAPVARLAATLFFSFFALTSWCQSDLTTEADMAFERRGYFEAAREYVALYAKVKSDVELKAYCASGQVKRTACTTNQKWPRSGTTRPLG